MQRLFFISLFLVSLLASAQKTEYLNVSDIPYSYNKDAYSSERCKLDVYYPEKVDSLSPVVVWFHGGGLTGGKKAIPARLKNQGLVVVAANYRLLPNVEVDACIDDAAAAIAWTFREIEKYGGDKSRIYVSGHSAGGYLAAMTGLEKKWLAKYGVDPDSIAALIPYSGQMISHYSYRAMHGIGSLQPTIDQFAPLYHVRNDAPPIILISGDREMELYGRYEENAYMARMLKLVGHPNVQLYEIGGYNHGDMAQPAHHILLNYIKNDK